MRILFYDTETSDMPLWGRPSSDPAQPHVVQLGALLLDTTERRVISEIDLLIRPLGWECSAETIAIHGITNERALEEGVDEALAINMLYELWTLCDLRVGHNESFDARMLRIALKRFVGSKDADLWKVGPAECTKTRGAGVVQGRGGDRPHLADYYRHYTGKELVDAHTARADMRATMEVYLAQIGLDPEQASPPAAAPPQPEAVQRPDGWHTPKAHARHDPAKECGCIDPGHPAAVACECGATYDSSHPGWSTTDLYCYDCRRKVRHG